MEFRQLTYFLAAAQTQNFRKASDICLVAQPALSRQIAALEAELGVALFKREKQHVTLTAAGREFAGYVRAAFDQLQQGQLAMAKIQEGSQGQLLLGCVEPLAATFLPAMYALFHQHYPAVQVTIRVTRTDEVMQSVEHGEMDLGFIFDPTAQSQTLVVKELFRQPLHLLVASQHPLAQADPASLTLQRVTQEPLILLSQHSRLRRSIERICLQRSLPIQPAVEIDSIEGLKELVKQSAGVTLLPPALLHTEQNRDDVLLRPLVDVSDTFIFALVYRRFGTISPQARQFINMVTEEIATGYQ